MHLVNWLCAHRYLLRIAQVSFFIIICSQLTISGFAQTQPPSNDKSVKANSVNSSALDDKGIRVIPFKYDPPRQPFITIQARINGSAPLTFMVDTASGLSLVVAPWVQKQLNLKTIEPTDVPGKIQGYIAEGGHCAFVSLAGTQDMDVNVPQVVVAELPLMKSVLGPNIAGIIGGDFFHSMTSRIDFDKHTLTFILGTHLPMTPAARSVILPLLLGQDGYRAHVDVKLPGGNIVNAIIDTGCDGLIIPKELVNKDALLGTGFTGAYTALDAEHTAQFDLLTEVFLEKLAVPIVPIAEVDEPNIRFGITLLSRFRVTLDVFNKQVIFEPRQNAPLTYRGNSGIKVAVGKQNFIVVQVNSNAAKLAGVEMNDEVIEIDGQKIKDLPVGQVDNLLDGISGTWMNIVIAKPNHKQISVHLLRRSSYKGVIQCPQGMVLLKTGDDRLRVVFVQPGSVAYTAGVRAQDLAVSVNGKPIHSADIDKMEEILAIDGKGASQLKEMTFKQSGTGSEIVLRNQ